MKEEEEDQVGVALNDVFVRLLNFLFYFFSISEFLILCFWESFSGFDDDDDDDHHLCFISVNQSESRKHFKAGWPRPLPLSLSQAAGWGGAAVRKRRGLH